MMISIVRKRCGGRRDLVALLACSTAIALTAGVPARAQEGAADSGIEATEIVVTANKREQNAQDVGIAVSALGADRLESISKQDISALTRSLPAVQIQSIGLTGNAVFNIRGASQADYSPHQEAPIAFYSDGVYMANMSIAGTEFYDLERLEVLRGPQGTLFGRNATGGLVQIYSKKPTKELDGYLTLTGGNFGTFVGEGAIGGPITDHIRARLSLQTKQGGAYIKNLTGRDLGDDHFYAGRLQLAADVGETGQLLLKVEHARDENGTGAGVTIYEPATQDEFGRAVITSRNYNLTVAYPDITHFYRRVTNLSANYTQDIGALQFTSITGYVTLNKDTLAPSPIAIPGVSAGYTQHHWQISQELRLSDNEGPFRWTAGGYYLDFKSESRNLIDVTGAPLPDFVSDIADINSTFRTRSIALFAQAEFDLSDQFTAIGGLRYGWDRLRGNILMVENGVTTLAFNSSTYPNLARQNHGDWSGKFELDYKPTEDVLIYASVNRGTKAGGFNVITYSQGNTPDQIAGQTFFKGEVLTNYEGGFKLTFLDRRAHFNVTGFHYDYKNYQAFAPEGLNFALRNANADVNGAEADFDIRPVKGLTLSAFGAYLDAKGHDIRVGTPGQTPSSIVSDRTLAQSPKWTLGGSAKYDVDLGTGTLTLQSNVKWQSKQYFFIFNQPGLTDPAYAVVDAQVRYAFANVPVEISVFCNNLTDKRYRLFTVDDSFLGSDGFGGNRSLGKVESAFAKPRYYGVSLTYKLGAH